MNHKDKRISLADTTAIINGLLQIYDDVTIEADKQGFKVVVWEKQQGNRAPVKYARRKCLGDAINEIERSS